MIVIQIILVLIKWNIEMMSKINEEIYFKCVQCDKYQTFSLKSFSGIRETVSKRSLDSNVHDKRYGLCLTQKRKCITTNTKEGHQKLVIFYRYRINCESCMTLLCLKAFLTHGTFIFRGGGGVVGNGKGLRIK